MQLLSVVVAVVEELVLVQVESLGVGLWLNLLAL
jgi:hypothetical protein